MATSSTRSDSIDVRNRQGRANSGIAYEQPSLIDNDARPKYVGGGDDALAAYELNRERADANPVAFGMREGFRATGRIFSSGEGWADMLTFRWKDALEREMGIERIRRTNELKRLEADRQAEEALARKRKVNLAAGLALMQNANMVNFFR